MVVLYVLFVLLVMASAALLFSGLSVWIGLAIAGGIAVEAYESVFPPIRRVVMTRIDHPRMPLCDRIGIIVFVLAFFLWMTVAVMNHRDPGASFPLWQVIKGAIYFSAPVWIPLRLIDWLFYDGPARRKAERLTAWTRQES